MTGRGDGADPGASTSLNALLRAGARRLEGIEGASPAGDARELAEWAFGAESVWSIREPLDPSGVRRFEEGVARRERREPLQWITSRMHFAGLALKAGPGVFLVRPETEVLVEEAIRRCRAIAAERGGVNAVDLCAGSGAIGIAIAHHVPGARVWAVEIDRTAWGLAAENISALVPGRVALVPGDATDPATLAELDGAIDIVVSNPPYVPPSEAPTQPEALRDPDLALFGGGADGMEIPTGILARALRLLKEGGCALVEHSESQGEAMRRTALGLGFSAARTMPDLTGRDRCLIAERGRMTR